MQRDYQQQLGDRLRSIRSQQGLTLQDVEEKSGGTWKAVVVGSYERGDRAISVAKLSRLASFYGVPMRDLLPRTENADDEAPGEDPRIVLDLTHLPDPSADRGRLAALSRYVRQIQLRRGDYNGRVLSLRADDLRALATAFGQDPAELVAELAEREAVRPPV